jgi:hypothetical protein
MQRAAAQAPARTAAGLVRAALGAGDGGLAAGLARMTLRGAGPPPLDLSEHCVGVADVIARAAAASGSPAPRTTAPPNLFLTPSVVNSEDALTDLETALLEPGSTACGCRSDHWRRAVAPLRATMASTPGRFVVFFDTDAELRERAPSRLALSIAERAVLLLSADWRAYIRLKADSRNSLFRFLEELHAAGQPHARIDMLLANGIQKASGKPVSIPWPADVAQPGTPPPGTPPPALALPFTPVAATRRELPQIAGNMFAHVEDTAHSRTLWFSQAAATGELQGFFSHYVRALSLFAPNVDQVTTGTGVPIVSLTPGGYTIGGARLFAALLRAFACLHSADAAARRAATR